MTKQTKKVLDDMMTIDRGMSLIEWLARLRKEQTGGADDEERSTDMAKSLPND